MTTTQHDDETWVTYYDGRVWNEDLGRWVTIEVQKRDGCTRTVTR